VNCGSGHIQRNYTTAYSGFNIRLNLSALILEIIRHVYARYNAFLVPNTTHIVKFTLCELWSRTYTMHLNSIYSDFNIHLNVSAMLLHISRQFNARYTANLLPNTVHILQFMLCEMWSRPYPKYLQLRIFRP
jgi:hypothetical protein